MILCIDIGNTNIVLGTYENNKLTNSFRIKTDLGKTSDDYGATIIQIMNLKQVNYGKITGMIISSVVPVLDRTFNELGENYFHVKPMIVAPGLKSGIKIKLSNPKELGADLLVGAVAATTRYGSPAIVVDVGTAITFAVVNKDNEFLGGIICPGIRTSYESLTEKTSLLEKVKMEYSNNVIGNGTVAALQSGMVFGTASMIDGVVRKIKKEIGDAKVVITGGDASILASYLEEKAIVDNNLLLDGLMVLYNKNNI